MKKIYIIILIFSIPTMSLACHGNSHLGTNVNKSFEKFNYSNYALKFRCGGYTNNDLGRDICYSY